MDYCQVQIEIKIENSDFSYEGSYPVQGWSCGNARWKAEESIRKERETCEEIYGNCRIDASIGPCQCANYGVNIDGIIINDEDELKALMEQASPDFKSLSKQS
jgi:hypothetical protein